MDVVGAARKAADLKKHETTIIEDLFDYTDFPDLKKQYPNHIKKDTTFNPRSRHHINAWLLRTGAQEMKSVAEAAVERTLPNELFQKIMAGRRCRKFWTDLENLRKYVGTDGKIHVQWTEAITGRWYTGKPPIQTMSKVCREFLVPDSENFFFVLDWAQQELRFLAHLSQEADLIKTFEEGNDPHALAFERVTGLECSGPQERDIGKMLNYALIYGLEPQGLGARLKIPNDQAKFLIDQYFEAFPAIQHWREAQKEKVRSDGYVETFSGRRIGITWDGDEDRAARKAVNYLVQGSAADQLVDLLQRLALENLLGPVRATIHDALLLEPTSQAQVEQTRYFMEKPFCGVQIPVESKGPAHNWLEAMAEVEKEAE